MKIILNADDFGFDHNTVKATIDCFERGALTSATIMPTAPAVQEAIVFAKRNTQFSFGVHLTYCDGLSPASEFINNIKSLVNKSGKFLPSNFIRLKSLSHLTVKKHIINETRKQIELLLDAGISVSHVDSHGHIHKIPIFIDALEETLSYYGLKKVRKVQDLNIAKEKSLILHSLNKKWDSLIKTKFTTTSKFYMPASTMDTNWAKQILLKIDDVDSQKTIEIGVHPGTNEHWRESEYQDIIEFSNLISATKHFKINWNDIK